MMTFALPLLLALSGSLYSVTQTGSQNSPIVEVTALEAKDSWRYDVAGTRRLSPPSGMKFAFGEGRFAVSPDGRYLAASCGGGRRGTVLWDLRRLRATKRIFASGGEFVSWSPDSKSLAMWSSVRDDEAEAAIGSVASGKVARLPGRVREWQWIGNGESVAARTVENGRVRHWVLSSRSGNSFRISQSSEAALRQSIKSDPVLRRLTDEELAELGQPWWSGQTYRRSTFGIVKVAAQAGMGRPGQPPYWKGGATSVETDELIDAKGRIVLPVRVNPGRFPSYAWLGKRRILIAGPTPLSFRHPHEAIPDSPVRIFDLLHQSGRWNLTPYSTALETLIGTVNPAWRG